MKHALEATRVQDTLPDFRWTLDNRTPTCTTDTARLEIRWG